MTMTMIMPNDTKREWFLAEALNHYFLQPFIQQKPDVVDIGMIAKFCCRFDMRIDLRMVRHDQQVSKPTHAITIINGNPGCRDSHSGKKPSRKKG